MPKSATDDPYKVSPPGTSGDTFDKILKHIYKTQSFPEHLYKVRLAQYAQHIWEAAEKGYGSGLEIGNEHKAKLNFNTWQFAAAKTKSELNNITRALADKDGVMLTESGFRAEAIRIAEQYNNWLDAEKSTAFRSGQMVYKWQDLQATKSNFPLIEFDAILDDRTTELCRSLDKIIVPAGHKYLELYWPPNHFFCRLNVRKIAKGTPTPADKLPYPIIPENFRQNLAAQGQVLPAQGGYFKDIPAMPDAAEMRWVNPLYFIEEKFSNGGLVRAHERMDRDKKNNLLDLAIKLAKQNNRVDLTPEIHAYNQQARQLFYPEIPADSFKNPDMRINGLLADFKCPESWTDRKLANLLSESNKQYASISIISIEKLNVDLKKLANNISGSLGNDNNYRNINELWLITDIGRIIKMNRSTIQSGEFKKLLF